MGKEVNLDEARQVLDGVMLSDGSLREDRKNSSLYVNQSGSVHLDWLLEIKAALLGLGIEVSSIYPKVTTRTSGLTGKDYEYCYLVSRAHSMLTEQRSRWYNMASKEVPDDLVLSPATLAHWFMGDGSSSWVKKNPNLAIASFSTESYSLKSVELLRDKLGKLDIETAIGFRKGTNWNTIIVGSIASICRLMELVEPYILPSYRYKLKKPYYLRRIQL